MPFNFLDPDFWVIRHEFEVSQNYYCPTEVFEREFLFLLEYGG